MGAIHSVCVVMAVFAVGSHCGEHPWKVRSFNPDKRSIFALEEEGEEELWYAYSQQREEDKPTSIGQTNGSTRVTCSEQSLQTYAEGSCTKEDGVSSSGQATGSHSEQLCVCDREQQQQQQQQGGLAVTSPSKTTATAGKLASIKGTSSKTFVICGGNAAPL